MNTNAMAVRPAGIRSTSAHERLTVALASETDRDRIYEYRHEVYARELGQHPPNSARRLSDALDAGNVYLVARCGDDLAAFVSITLPGQGSYSIDKYFAREQLPFTIDAGLFEIRLLTVLKPHRGREVASVLMYAAFRWIESHGGEHIVAIGRREVLDMYLKAGLKQAGLSARSGAVTYDLLYSSVTEVRQTLQSFRGLLTRLESRTRWQLSFPFHKPAACFHGGAFFTRIGERFDALHRHEEIINADVLDAWFPPSPRVVAALQEHLPWLVKTSPPTGCEGLIETIAEVRGVRPHHVLPGGGSSDLIFRAFRQWLSPRAHVLLLDPTYGEYAHVLERVIGCTVDRLTLTRTNHYDVDLTKLTAALGDHYDLIVLVNPNSPTGRMMPADVMKTFLRQVPQQTRVWIDETYVDYAGAESMEHLAARSENVIVCKSMSKAYALSGVRSAYLCAGPHQLEELRAITPPWVVSLPAQVSAVNALLDPGYYAARYAETRALREEFAIALQSLSWDVIPGVANFLLCHLPVAASAAEVVEKCRAHGLFLRDASTMGSQLGRHAVRIAVKDSATNLRMCQILRAVSGEPVGR
jgi:histidinol-phosphate/aromatic aminotransferase/cobyric acid decarboxylase-like protein/GNAT superfamily N-acetyltransferase